MEQRRVRTWVTLYLAQPLLTPRRTLGFAFQRVWNLLVLRDNWQGEFSVALFGAIGWALVSILADKPITELPIYAILSRIAPEWLWEFALILFGSVQLLGLKLNDAWLRVGGALGVFVIFVCIVSAISLVDPGTRSIGFGLASICIEFCAIVFQTARIVRTRERATWPWTYKR